MNQTAAPESARERLLTAPPLTLLLRMASPNAVAFLVQAGVSVTEVWYVGQLGTISLAAMGLMFPWAMLMGMLANGAIGGAVTGAIARALGTNAVAEAERLIWHALVIALLAGLLLLLVVLMFLDPLLRAATDNNAVISQAKGYALFLFAGSPLTWTMALLSSVHRGMGNMQFPAMLMVVGAAIQVPLSAVLILGLFGVPSLGITGAAISMTVVAATSSSALIWSLRRQSSTLRLTKSRLQLSGALFARILRVGLPSCLSPVFTVGTISGVNFLVGGFGVAALAGYGIGSRIEFLLIPMVFGLGVSMTTLVGVNLGAGKTQRATTIGWVGSLSAAAITGVVGLVLALAPDLWVGLFSDDRPTQESARLYLQMAGPFFAFQGLGLTIYFASQGAGTVKWPIIAGFARLLCAIGLGYAAVTWFAGGLAQIYLAAGFAMFVFGSINAGALKMGMWVNKHD